jgi:hypothetical protein
MTNMVHSMFGSFLPTECFFPFQPAFEAP